MIPHILIIENDEENLNFLSNSLSEMHYTFDIAFGQKDALLMLPDIRYQVMLIKVDESGNNYLEFETAFREYPEIIMIIMWSQIEANQIGAILNKSKAYENLFKPFNKKSLKNTINKAFEIYSLRKKAGIFNEKENKLYNNFLSTFDWNNEIRLKQIDSIAHKIIRQMNIGFFHGGGIGSLLSSMSMLMEKAKFNESKRTYEIPEDLFALVTENFNISIELAKSLSNAQNILMQTKYYSAKMWPGEIFDFVKDCVFELKDMLSIKKQKIYLSKLPEIPVDSYIIFNREKMRLVIVELLINAMKYSNNNDIIVVLFVFKMNYFEMKLLNPAYQNEDGTVGITDKNEMLIFEPFYRLNSIAYENYSKEEFGYGLGLTVVDKVIELHKANISTYTIKNRVKDEQKKEVCVTIRYPVGSTT